MAKNLKWLCEVKYPHQKIIVWAHNVHVSKYNGHYSQSFLNQMKTMGGVFTSDGMFMKETYILGFTSYEGTAGRLFHQQYQLPEPKRNSLERWINPAYQYAFIDFKPFRKQYPKYKKQFFMAGSILGNEHHTISKARWDKIFDGVFFIRKMYPCKNIN
jgi:erythromycin esterase-like protein